MIIWVKIFQTELMFEIYSKSLVRAKIKTHKSDEKWPLFVN